MVKKLPRPKGFGHADYWHVSDGVDRISEKIYARQRQRARLLVVVMGRDGYVYAHSLHRVQGVLKDEEIVGIYNYKSSPEDIAEDLREHARQLRML